MVHSLKRRLEHSRKTLESQKGFTLIEMLIVVAIIAAVITIVAVNFSVFDRVDGTTEAAKAKNVEGAVMQATLAHADRHIPALFDPLDPTISVGAPHDPAATQYWENNTDARIVIKAVLESYGVWDDLDVTGTDTDDVILDRFEALIQPINQERVEPYLTGDYEFDQYFVVARKAQVDDGTATYANNSDYANYNDDLAGVIFTERTIVDSEGTMYNGAHVITP